MDRAVRAAYRHLLRAIQERSIPLEEAERDGRQIFEPEDVEAAVQLIRGEMAANFVPERTVLDVSYSNSPRWYLGPRDDGHWARYRKDLLRKRHPGLAQLDNESTLITALLADPQRGGKRKGLVMGNVQSGKTANFAGVVAKAADAGYRMVIVLSGLHNNLRRQTQIRLQKDVFHAGAWLSLTSEDHDFESTVQGWTLFRHKVPVAAVVKKNTARLSRLLDWLSSIPWEVRRQSPVLIIDDEADQATPNSEAQKNKISAINHKLQQIWAEIPNGSYVAYTATPFANVFMNPDDLEDLFPSHFITTLTTGPGYFGAQRVLGISDMDGADSDGLDMVRPIPASEAEELRPPSNADARAEFVPAVTPTLKDSVRWFLIATAVRWFRGQRSHSSMLVHTTHYADPHKAMAVQLNDLLRAMKMEIDSEELAEFSKLWDAEKDRAGEVRSQVMPEFTDVERMLPVVLEACSVIVDNGQSNERLDYDTADPQTVIAVGGGTLSRGLTLEGLVSSYFVRTTNTYDTLMQMGRWFGYRAGYEDLPRIWVADGLDEDYAFLARVEAELREEIESFSRSEFTPAQVGVRVRAHPGRLEITSRNRMYHARTVQVSMSGVLRQTFIVNGLPWAVEQNMQAANELLAGVDPLPIHGGATSRIVRGLDNSRIQEFLNSFIYHDEQEILNEENRQLAIDWMMKSASNASWNVVIVGNPSSMTAVLGQTRIAGELFTNVNRSPMKGSTLGRINLKALTSPSDFLSDLPASQVGTNPDLRKWRAIRREHGLGQGLVLLYPISGASHPSADRPGNKRMAMPDGASRLMGFGIVFPEITPNGQDGGEFLSVRPSWEMDMHDEDLDAESDSDWELENNA